MKKNRFSRRDFTHTVLMTGAGMAAMPLSDLSKGRGRANSAPTDNNNFKISLNAYSFDKPLRAGTMTLDDLLDFCAQKGFDGADLTGYYFPGYPAAPADDVIFHIRKKAFRLGIDLGCTGVRNDFTWFDKAKRSQEKKLVKDWIIVAQKLGAPGLRIFSGNLSKENYSWDERAAWIAADIRECADFAASYGVMLALQNHNDFLKTSEQTEKLMTMINHEWVGLMLDIGSYHSNDPYTEIEASSKYAITWQMKEKIFVNDTQVDTDFPKIISIVRRAGYRGYLPIETIGDGDPYQKVAALLEKVRSAR